MTTKTSPDRPLTAEEGERAASGYRLVFGQADRRRRRAGRRLDPDALVDAGTDALLRAARYFDPGRGCQFATYATTAIAREMAQTARPDAPPPLPDWSLPDPAAADPAGHAETAELLARLPDAEAQLPVADRQLLGLCFAGLASALPCRPEDRPTRPREVWERLDAIRTTLRQTPGIPDAA